jgi:hypothetical protein
MILPNTKTPRYEDFVSRVQKACCSVTGTVCFECLVIKERLASKDLPLIGGMIKALKEAADLPEKCEGISPIPDENSEIMGKMQKAIGDKMQQLANNSSSTPAIELLKLKSEDSNAMEVDSPEDGKEGGDKEGDNKAEDKKSDKHPELQQSTFQELVKNSFRERIDKEKYQVLEWQREAKQVESYRQSEQGKKKGGTGFQKKGLSSAGKNDCAVGVYSLVGPDGTSSSSSSSSATSLALSSKAADGTSSTTGRVRPVAVPSMFSALEQLYYGPGTGDSDKKPEENDQQMVGFEIMDRLTIDFCLAIQDFESGPTSSDANTSRQLQEFQIAEQTRAVASLISLYRGPDADVMVEMLRVSGLCANLHEAGSKIMRELIIKGYKEKETMPREQKFLKRMREMEKGPKKLKADEEDGEDDDEAGGNGAGEDGGGAAGGDDGGDDAGGKGDGKKGDFGKKGKGKKGKKGKGKKGKY